LSPITYVYLSGSNPRKLREAERPALDRFVAAFVNKKGVSPAGHWKVPRVGYCVFLGTRLDHLEQ
jgi:hypothetical protein